jgi:hypothetical protein
MIYESLNTDGWYPRSCEGKYSLPSLLVFLLYKTGRGLVYVLAGYIADVEDVWAILPENGTAERCWLGQHHKRDDVGCQDAG